MAKAIPDGFYTLTPFIIVPAAGEATEFYKQAFGAQEIERHMMPDGKAVMHASLRIGNSMLLLAREFPPTSLSPKSLGGTSFSLHIYVENVDSMFDSAVKAGCTVRMPLSDQYWGDRYGELEDPFGHQWSIGMHTQDLTPDQIIAKAKEAFAKVATRNSR